MQQQGSASHRPASSAKVNCFKLLDGDSRLKVFSCLSWQDLGRASATSKAFRRYCRHRCLTQNADRQRVLHVGDSADQFLALLASSASLNQFATYPKLKIVRGVKLARFSTESEPWPWGEPACAIRGVTSLELAFDSSSASREGREATVRSRSPLPDFVPGLWKPTAACFPNLRHLTVSDERGTELAAFEVAATCRRLESVTFHRQTSSHLLLWAFGNARRLRAMHMDDCTFQVDRRSDVALVDDGRSDRCIFDDVADQLERLSLRNARICYRDDDENNVRDLPQSAIIKFVRRAANLAWLRSDLTPENVAMFQRERPDVTFVQ
jgi:hypothetical protein